MNLNREFLKMLRGAWLVILLQAVFWYAVLYLVWHYAKPYLDALILK